MSNVEQHKRPGVVLKQTREKLGLSINDVAVATKISPRILKALEEGDHGELPPQSFTRGFIRSYSAYLKIDAQPVLEAYSFVMQVPPATISVDVGVDAAKPTAPLKSNAPTKGAVKEPSSDPAAAVAAQEPTTSRKMFLSERSVFSRALIFGGLIIAVAIVIGVKKIFDRYARERIIEPTVSQPLDTSEPSSATEAAATSDGVSPNDAASAATDSAMGPVENSETAVTTSKESATAEPANATEPAVKPAETAAAVKSVLPTPTPVVTTTPAPTVAKPVTPTPSLATPITKPTAPMATTATPAVTPQVKPGPVATATPSVAKPAAPSASPQEVILEALDNVEVMVSIDGESPKKIKLTPESIHTIKAKTSITIDIQDGGMVNLTHNGRDKGVPGNLGKSAQLKFP